ncbi:CsbD family protein [Salicibibacter cibi]|uniref:CsbD family protein n=1 Tax=Salicibibacter cibi TaxID=2743001 RepID=A0A7T7CDZ7_9BACI|nr:CsbD family protein [Salicibibacter cibi]QQK78544.1 CsbD family protein [Salicibibacter cibi]
MSISEKMKSVVSKAKGETKDQIGNAMDNTKMQAEGKKDKMKGDAQNAVGEARNKDKQNEK